MCSFCVAELVIWNKPHCLTITCNSMKACQRLMHAPFFPRCIPAVYQYLIWHFDGYRSGNYCQSVISFIHRWLQPSLIYHEPICVDAALLGLQLPCLCRLRGIINILAAKYSIHVIICYSAMWYIYIYICTKHYRVGTMAQTADHPWQFSPFQNKDDRLGRVGDLRSMASLFIESSEFCMTGM